MYVGSASNERYDQELENVLVGPVPLGTSKFILTVCVPPAHAPARRTELSTRRSHTTAETFTHVSAHDTSMRMCACVRVSAGPRTGRFENTGG